MNYRPETYTKVGPYILGETLGKGSFSKVKIGVHETTDEKVAIKIISKERINKANLVDHLSTEVKILRLLNHHNITQLKEVLMSTNHVFLVMELALGGDLYGLIADDGPLDESTARSLFLQLVDAVEYCHSMGVVHRDLKPENILLTAKMEVKLSDFGLGVVDIDANTRITELHSLCGTPHYLSPEVVSLMGSLREDSYDGKKADLWALGVVLYVMLAGCLPFEEADRSVMYEKIMWAEFTMPPWISDQAIDIIKRLLQPNPSRRATIAELRQHPWTQPSSSPSTLPTPLRTTTTTTTTNPSNRSSLSSYPLTTHESPLLPLVQHHQQNTKSNNSLACPQKSCPVLQALGPGAILGKGELVNTPPETPKTPTASNESSSTPTVLERFMSGKFSGGSTSYNVSQYNPMRSAGSRGGKAEKKDRQMEQAALASILCEM